MLLLARRDDVRRRERGKVEAGSRERGVVNVRVRMRGRRGRTARFGSCGRSVLRHLSLQLKVKMNVGRDLLVHTLRLKQETSQDFRKYSTWV